MTTVKTRSRTRKTNTINVLADGSCAMLQTIRVTICSLNLSGLTSTTLVPTARDDWGALPQTDVVLVGIDALMRQACP
jgi:hypothetical protein